MNEIQTSAKAAENVAQGETGFRGYTLEELKYQRALVTLQKEFCRSRLMRNIGNLQKSNPLSPSAAASSLPGKVGFIASKVFSGLNYLDYAMLGFSVFGAVRKVFSIFRRNRKK